jgi:hypothetical protein
MPAPIAQAFQQLARTKFTSFGIKVPMNWKEPQGEDKDHWDATFTAAEKETQPGFPPLFLPASLNKYHTDVQKMHIAKTGAYIDGICSAICSAWSQWQTQASMVGVMVNAVTASGGQIVGPPLQPLIMMSAPKNTPGALRFSTVIATVISNAWLQFTATVKLPGLPLYPAFAAVPAPVAPPMPNVPVPFAQLVQVPVSISTNAMKPQMIAQLADPQNPFHKELFESICFAFEQSYNLWKISTMVTNMIGTGPTTFVPAPVPIPGAVVGGMAQMPPGGFV